MATNFLGRGLNILNIRKIHACKMVFSIKCKAKLEVDGAKYE